MKIYGPYLRSDGRKHAIIIYSDGSRKTKSWPRLLMENHLGRELLHNETVDHIDNDFTNDSLDNLQILTLKENISKEHKRNPRQVYRFICPICYKESEKFLNYVINNRKKNKSGPFCSRSCAGKFSHKIYKQTTDV